MDIDADRLLVLVEARPAIYNFNLKEHCNQDVINQLWSEIGQELNITGTLFTVYFPAFFCQQKDMIEKIEEVRGK